MIIHKIAFARTLTILLLSVALTSAIITGADWPTRIGSPQRDGWARSEKVFTKDSVTDLDLLYQYQTDNKSKGLYSLTPPLISGMLITYRGFKEMLVFGGSSDNVYSVDADLNKLIWKTHFEYKADGRPPKRSTVACPGGLTASIAMAGSSSARASFGRRSAPPAGTHAPIGGSGFGSLGAFFAVSGDGYLHALNASTGEDLMPAVEFVPPNSHVSALNVYDNQIYAVTSGDCGGSSAVYRVDLGSTDKKVSTLPFKGNAASGAAGTAIGNDGTVYVQMASEPGATDGAMRSIVAALDPATLSVKDYFVIGQESGSTPMIFSWKGKDMILAAGGDGRLYLLDSTSLGGPDHQKAAFKTEPIAAFRGGFSSWSDDAAGVRWIYASLAGPPSIKFPTQNGDVQNGGVVAFTVQDQNGQPALSPAWISVNMASPSATITAGGLVFALSSGEAAQEARPNGKPYKVSELEKASTHATLYALDGATGKQLYTSAGKIASPALNSGLAIANGRIYFGTSDNTMNAFGFPKMQPQLTDK